MIRKIYSIVIFASIILAIQASKRPAPDTSLAASNPAKFAKTEPSKSKLSETLKNIAAFQDIIPVKELQKLIMDYLPEWELIQTIKTDFRPLTIAYSQDGRYILVSPYMGKDDGKILIWELKNGIYQFKQELPSLSRKVRTIAISPLGTKIAASYDDPYEIIWFENKNDKFVYAGKLPGIAPTYSWQVNFADEDYLGTIFGGPSARIWQFINNTPKIISDVKTEGQQGQDLKFFKGRNFLITRNNRYIEIWKWNGNRYTLLQSIDVFFRADFGVTIDGNYLAIADDDKVNIWRFENNKFALKQEIPFKSATSVALTPDGRYLAVLENNTEISIWKLVDGEYVKDTTLPIKISGGKLLFTADGSLLLAAFDYDLDYENSRIEIYARQEIVARTRNC